LRILDALAGPEPKTPADQQRERERERIERALHREKPVAFLDSDLRGRVRHGVVTGIVMPFQFGTNWSGLSDTAGNIVGPSLAYEGLTAFFLEAAFLGVLLFGRT
jgi:hypothetical protein